MDITQPKKRWFSFVALFVLLFVAAIFLGGCSPDGSTDLPGERPYGSIAGNAIDATLVGSDVTVYGFADGTRSVTLGRTTTDENGSYALNIQAASQPILIEVSGGSYVEDASGTSVMLTDGQVLRAITNYVSGETIGVMVTPLTHLTAGLAEFKIRNGSSIGQAITDATAEINGFFSIATTTTLPLLITDVNNASTELNDQALYGFYLAGLSSWTSWASHENNATHNTYSSIALAQILYNDIRSDGLVNGIGYNTQGTELMPLAFGRVALDENTFRAIFSLHMLAIANSDDNKTGLGVDILHAAAQTIASQTSTLLGTAEPINIDEQTPEISITKSADEFHSGIYNFDIDIGGLLGAEHISVSIDDELQSELEGSTHILVIVDSTTYTDGEHVVLVTATDALGNVATSSFNVKFDNTAPVISVTSPPASALPSTLITGTYSDNVSGVQSIIAQGQPATLFTDGTWSATVTIEPGENIIPITVIDNVGKRLVTQTTLHLDVIAPVIVTTDQHSLARFSASDGSFTSAPLQDMNDAASPLYIETNTVDLNGVLIDRTELDNNTIPYFAFSVSDQMGAGVTTAPEDIQVRMQYEQGGVILTPWREVSAIGGEYLIPLVSETLAPDWHQATPADQHVIQIEVSDAAGNLSNLSLSFYVDFYVPALTIGNDNISDLAADIFSPTVFTDRTTLNGVEFASTTYTFTNSVGKSFYLSLDDASVHTTTQTVDQLVREHLVNLKTTPEWRVGLMKLNTDPGQCPEMINWENTSAIWNWTGPVRGWVQEQVPAASFGAPEAVSSDALPPDPSPSASDWSDAPDFDGEFWVESTSNPLYLYLNYGYDYLLDLTSSPLSAASIILWTRQERIPGSVAEVCPQKRYFQQREVYTYESVAGYPKPVLSSVTVAGTPDFVTSNFTVMDIDTGLAIVPIGDWYQIPAGHSVTITKWVTTPVLTFYKDDVSDLSNFSSYAPNWHDSSIVWEVDRSLAITVSHDVGEANISAMPARTDYSGAGVMSYQITN